jgi:hypothetical protein
MFFLFYRATEDLPADIQRKILITVGIWIFVFAKSIKLYGHWIRYPADLLMLPFSILFGHLHGLIKLVGLLTLSAVCYIVLGIHIRQSLTVRQTSWGSRDGADEDNHYRMIKLPPYDIDGLETSPLPLASGSDNSLSTTQYPPPYQKHELDETCPLQGRYSHDL